jgi:serine/threonine-protein kinase
MTSSRWDRIEELFEAASPLRTAQRADYLAGVCGNDHVLRAEIEAMVAAEQPARALRIERMAPRDASAEPSVDPTVGTSLGPWRVIRELGRGGMGTVYLAERADGLYRQQVALKLASPVLARPEAMERFCTERQVLARLGHPNIARLLDGGLAPDRRPYFVMELIDGAPITQWCTSHDLSVADRLRLFRVVCDAVQHAHEALVVHRDLKPANIFVSSAGEVKLLDFGIAKLLDPALFGQSASTTRTGETVMTPEYAAPEQLLGGPITTATDVYALGVVLYELLTGVRPLTLDARTSGQVERAVASARIVPPSELLGRSRRDDLDSVVLAALRVESHRRYVSAAQFGEDIARFLEGRPVLAQRDTLGYRARKFIARNRAAVLAAAAIAVSLTLFAVLASWQARRAAAERDAAQLEREKAESVVGALVDLFEGSNPSVHPDEACPPVQEFLERAGPRVLAHLHHEPEIRARLQHVFSLIYEARGEYTRARQAQEQALRLQCDLGGPDHPDALESLHDLAELLQRNGDIEGARSILEESLIRHQRVFGDDDVRTVRARDAVSRSHADPDGWARYACSLSGAAPH